MILGCPKGCSVRGLAERTHPSQLTGTGKDSLRPVTSAYSFTIDVYANELRNLLDNEWPPSPIDTQRGGLGYIMSCYIG